VSLFEPKESCPHCGRKVGMPKDPSDFLCPHCGQPGPFASVDQVSRFSERESARATYSELLAAITTGPTGVSDGFELAKVRDAARFTAAELEAINLDAVKPAVATAVADDLITPEERSHLNGLLSTSGMYWDDVRRSDPELYEHAFVSSINGGQLPESRLGLHPPEARRDRALRM
jgi:hypothetical protein